MKLRYAHLSAGFMLTSIIGFLISIFFVINLSPTWGFTFCVFFALMFVSSVISMTNAPYTEKEYQNELAIHEPKPKKTIASNPPKPVKFNTYDSLMLVYAVLYLLYLIVFISSPATVNTDLFVIIFAITILLTIWLIVDIFTSETLTTGQQIGYTLMVLVLGGIGIAIYYFYKRRRM